MQLSPDDRYIYTAPFPFVRKYEMVKVKGVYKATLRTQISATGTLKSIAISPDSSQRFMISKYKVAVKTKVTSKNRKMFAFNYDILDLDSLYAAWSPSVAVNIFGAIFRRADGNVVKVYRANSTYATLLNTLLPQTMVTKIDFHPTKPEFIAFDNQTTTYYWCTDVDV
jgi:hypothetical protein